ncbi:MAG: hypothetical protein EA352_12715 [Gemmatimonadales bacterium]|nr:MAG: hypothetical protein EA352_12715 [Gemmatimonadales bacterium]
MGLLDRRDPTEQGDRLTVVARIVGAVAVLLAILFGLLLLLGMTPAQAEGQRLDLESFDWEHLSPRGAMLDVGWVNPRGVESTHSFGGRVDLGFIGPGVRVTAGFNRWSSSLLRSEVRSLEESLEALVLEQTDEEVEVDLGQIQLSDVALHGDAHFLWQIPGGLLGYAGMGASAHLMRGQGEAVDDTFVDDLLDQLRAGVNVHAGLELPVSERMRLVGESRWEFVQSNSYLQLRFGGQYTWGPLLRGESR